MRNKLLLLVFLLVILSGGYFIYKNSNHESSTGNFKVTASFFPMYYFASQIVGVKAQVINITPAGAEPHDYEPTPADIANIESSKLLILNGGKLEPWGDNIQNTLKSTSVKIVIAGEGLTNKTVTEDGNTMIDPHIWLSPTLAKAQIGKITQALEEIDPSNSNYYMENAKNLGSRLDQLDNDYKNGLKSCAKKDIVTSHAAFGYMAADYKLNQVPISGLSPDAEPSPAQLADVAKFVKDNNVKYIFFESLVSPKLSQTIANETNSQTLVLNPIEGLSDDEIRAGKDYFSEMQSNLTNLRLALQCQ